MHVESVVAVESSRSNLRVVLISSVFPHALQVSRDSAREGPHARMLTGALTGDTDWRLADIGKDMQLFLKRTVRATVPYM